MFAWLYFALSIKAGGLTRKSRLRRCISGSSTSRCWHLGEGLVSKDIGAKLLLKAGA